MRSLNKILQNKKLSKVDYNSDELLIIHKEILENKKIMKNVFSEFYSYCIKFENKYLKGNGIRAEIGAGVSFFKKKYPFIISTDIKKNKDLDMVVDALNMPWKDNTVKSIYGINCFHHFPDPDKFLHELERVLIPGGGCILIEPYYHWFASKFYKNMFKTEFFDKTQKKWNNSNNIIMENANQALSYIVFIRDYSEFQKKYPTLEIVKIYPMPNYIRYILSGGLNFISLFPNFLEPLLKGIEYLIYPFKRFFALHYIITIQKKHN